MSRLLRRVRDGVAWCFGVRESRWLRERDEERARIDAIRQALGFTNSLGLDVDDIVNEVRVLRLAVLLGGAR